MENMSIEELKKQYGMENNADIRERILMIIWLKSGKSTYEVGDLLFSPHSKVVYWKKRFESGGIDGLKTLKRSGRPGSIDVKAEEEIRMELFGSDHLKTTEISKVIEEKSGVRYTRRHIRRMAQEWGYALITPRKKHKNSASVRRLNNLKKSRKDTGFSQKRNDCSMHG